MQKTSSILSSLALQPLPFAPVWLFWGEKLKTLPK